ncbi:hypothetical protein [Cyanobium sp. CH-040]|uniref:hypothetical protein n=1 Tax=Cyanobium sp. CH-040 TaxID=2823708 RepID=UPI0020CC10E3|nr:hypothetical protein [Cyanobium sp. CH-040]MCP9927185.1 hypothetical protein [Cyanobium sp. CH-040]
MATAPKTGGERATERVAILMTPTEKATYTDRASGLGLSLGQFFREAGAAYASSAGSERQAESDALEAALKQLELSTARTEAALDDALAEVRAASMAGLMKEQQRRIDELNSRVIRLETVLELALNRSPLQTPRLTGSDSGRGTPE